MSKVLHKANTRGHANHGWLDSHHSFSFANYYDPGRMHFGVLRVLNDDIVSGGKGFGTHPHDNMEIISIPLEGDLLHKDSTGTTAVIRKNDVQIMSAGTGVYHSEYNNDPDEKVNFLQIWVIPKEQDIAPRYDQRTYDPSGRKNKFQNIVSPDKSGQGVWINQDAWFYLGNFSKGAKDMYDLKQKGNGVYIFVIKGNVNVDGQMLNRRDGLGVIGSESISFTAESDAEILVMEVPMN